MEIQRLWEETSESGSRLLVRTRAYKSPLLTTGYEVGVEHNTQLDELQSVSVSSLSQLVGNFLLSHSGRCFVQSSE